MANSAISRRVIVGENERVTGGDDSDGSDQLGGVGVFDQEAGGAGSQSFEDVLV